MQEQTQQDDSVLQIECEKCRYTAGPGMIKCPDRAKGRCPYELRRWWDYSLDVGLWGFYQSFTLYHPVQRVLWQRFTVLLFNREILVRKVSELQPLDVDLSSYPVPQHPASITMLFPGDKTRTSGMNEAVFIVQATLFDLIARQVIGLCNARIDERRQGKLRLNQREYLCVPGQKIDQGIAGELENRLVHAIKKHQGIVKFYTAGSTFPQAISIYKLVRSIYKVDQSDPAGELVSLIVKDAVTRGLGSMETSGFSGKSKKYVLNPSHADQISSDRQNVEKWIRRPQSLSNKIVRTLCDEIVIERAIHSREAKESWNID